ncbi:isoaspartyl peptidase/L-asparaginase [Caulobacter endophyticus]|uniref:Isoaspartyl peptidase n=1 Tax=Caulobacter endophyticus TaxID=2172652 RepID=A0A2T9KCG5_9CAUL|nr:isoaspartyl peptidase/L-asparaginase [Caulobacter endophyticus]PVM93657.1 asparaginase [Caulobacter endophyticus]
MAKDKDWAIIVHGGARAIAPDKVKAHEAGCLAAVAAGAAVLEAGGCAASAVEAAIRLLENDQTFNAGQGSVRNASGDVECDAAIMDGEDLAVGAVAAVRTIRNPISAAAAMLSEPAVLLVGSGAEAFADARGLARIEPERLAALAPSTDGCDTVGCVAFDSAHRLAAGASTGGLQGSTPGRVGDTPLPGCGLYADNTIGATCLSGDGESLIRVTLASRFMRHLETLDPDAAAKAALAALARVGGEAGLVAIDRHGQIGWDHNSPQFAVAYARAGRSARAFVSKRQEEEDR